MGMPSEERSKWPLCAAKKKDGGTCRAFAGQGTDHPGTGRCKFHGGSTPTHRTAAVVAEAQQQMVKLGEPLPVRPDQALLGVLRATAGHVAWLSVEVRQLEDLTSHDSRVLVELYGQERDRLARVAKHCLDSGVSKVEVEVTQRSTEALATAVNNAVKSVGGFTDDQRRQFGEVLRLELQQVQAAAVEPETA